MTGGPTRMVIVEGTCGAGKSTLLRWAARELGTSAVRLVTQNETYGPLVPAEDAGALDDATIARSIVELVTSLKHELVSTGQIALVDTLHLTQFVRTRALSHASMDAIDEALRPLRPRTVLLRVSETAIFARAVVRRRGTGFYDYARKFGRTERDIARHFADEQARMIQLLHERRTDRVILDGDGLRERVLGQFVELVRGLEPD